MGVERSPESQQVPAAEVIGTLCLATDLGMGFPFEHGLRSTVIAARLAERLGVDPTVATETYYACLLAHSGCTTDAHVTAEIFGGSLTSHLHPVRYGSPRQVFSGIIRADRALAAMGSFGDLISPHLTGHSSGVAELAASAATRCHGYERAR